MATTTSATTTTALLGKGSGTTNPVPQSKVDVPIDVPVRVKFRFFPANVTALLEGHAPAEAKTLSGLPFVVGAVQGGALTPLHERLLRLGPGKSVPGKLDSGSFRPLTAEEVAAWHLARQDAKKKDSPPPSFMFHETPEFQVKSGTKVAICIGVDAKVKCRNHPLWHVEAGDHDIVVDVFETFGKALGLQEKVSAPVLRSEDRNGKKYQWQQFAARLTGDTWMRSTPKLTEADVDALPADRATEAMKKALKRIYSGGFDPAGQNFAIDVPRKRDEKDTASVRLVWIASENQNCVDNIVALNLKQDVPSRIHPEAYAAAAKAAHEAEIDEIRFSSSWRPMLGSMPHRLSMGLDLVYLKSGKRLDHLNRNGLLPDAATQMHASNQNLSKEEVAAYDEWKAKEKAADAALADLERSNKALKDAMAARRRIKNPASETAEKLDKAVEQAEAKQAEAKSLLEDRRDAARNAKDLWDEQVKQNEPGAIGRYRRYVMLANCVSQVLDPWYLVGLPNHKSGELVTNTQEGEGGLAFQHRNHMHLSLRDPELTA